MISDDNPIKDFARLDSSPLISPISLSIPRERPYKPSPGFHPEPGSVPLPAGYQGGIDPEHQFFPDANSLNQFLPASGVMDGSELTAGGNINPPPRTLDAEGSGNTTGPAASGSPDNLGYAEFVKFMRENRGVNPMDGYRPAQQKLIDKAAREYENPEGRKFDPNVVAMFEGDYKRSEADQGRVGRHKGGLVTDAQTGALEPGTETDMALLEGEFVMTRQAVEMFGVEFLDQLNAAAAQQMGQDAPVGPAAAPPAIPPAAPGAGGGPPAGPQSPLDDFASMI